MPAPHAHPDPGLIAAHAERRLAGADAVRMDAHLAGCPECYDTFAATVRFALDEEPEDALPGAAFRDVPLVQRPAFRIAAVLAVATFALMVAQQLWLRDAIEKLRQRGERGTLVAELAQAMGTTRFIEPRLTGGFQHGRLVVLRSGDRPQGLDAQSPAVLAAVAHIREKALGDTSPEALDALAATYLVSGDVDKAVQALESATAQDPGNPRLQSDLSAAYLVRATRRDEPADLPRALEAAEKAIELTDAPDEAWFNRALALEQLHLVDAARKAWQDYLERDSGSGWADEARKHLDELPAAQRSTIEQDRARARAALAEGPSAIDRLADEAPAILDDYFQSELLPAWADAQLTGHPSRLVLRTQAQQVGEALLRATGDALPRDAALALAAPPSGPARDPPRTQALGYKTLHEAQRLYHLQQPSCDTFREARRLLDAGGSPYSTWARERVVFACLYPAEPRPALTELGQLEAIAEAESYSGLVARVRWIQGLFLWHRGALTSSLERYGLAQAYFHAARDAEREGMTSSLLAETFHALGEGRRAWRMRQVALALLGEVRDPRRRHAMLEEAALACLDEKLPRCALAFQSAVVEAATRWSNAVAMADALVRRATMLQTLGSATLAAADLSEARRWIPKIGDRAFALRISAESDAIEGEVLIETQPERAVEQLERAVVYFEPNSPVRVPGLRLLLGRAQAGRGLEREAEAQLESGIETLESQRVSQRDATLQAKFFDQAALLFDAMVDLQLQRRHDPDRALLFVERGRARQLADSLASPPTDAPAADPPAFAMPLEPSAIRGELPEGVALVYYATREDRLLSWTLTRTESRFVEHPVSARELRSVVARQAAAIEQRAGLSLVREQAARLYDELVRPLEPALRSQRALVFVPDAALESVAFASLWDRQTSRYLVEDVLVGLVPSGTVFVKASAAATLARRLAQPSALVVGNPSLDASREGELTRLPEAEAEASDIAALYEHSELLTGDEATRSAFLGHLRRSRIVHFAGHAVSGDAPHSTQLLFAPDSAVGGSGSLYLRDLDGAGFPRTSVVVLAACRTAAGRVSRLEGALGLARPFLTAGVPSVVASLWDIDDAVGRRFFVAFHRSLLTVGEPLLALRKTQLAMLGDTDPLLAHPASWAGFVCAGGFDNRRLARAQ